MKKFKLYLIIHIYDNYINDLDLGVIKDKSGEATIKTNDGKIIFNLNKDEFNEVKTFLNDVEINDDNLGILCNLTT